MKQIFYALALAAFGFSPFTSQAQKLRSKLLLNNLPFNQSQPRRQCATMDVLNAQLAADPALAQRLEAIEARTQQFMADPVAQRATAVVTIPVVVHVLYNTTAQNISAAQVQSQIAVLNEDFNQLNADVNKTPSVFAGRVANVGIQFVLAKRDPNGNPTTGIVRKSTTVTLWAANDRMKSSATGGSNAWPASRYLNIWVCKMNSESLGYAYLPGVSAAVDGVVINTTAFGRGGSAKAPFNLGRTTTHEVGHWLNLRHIWGETTCGDDRVSDTPTQAAENIYCPSFPKVSCSNGPNGDMFMNYMDYTDDACMYMFTTGQSSRMKALFASGGARASLLTSNGATAPLLATNTPSSAKDVALFPNPASSKLSITVGEQAAKDWTVKVYDLRGYEMKQVQRLDNGDVQVDALPKGLYQVTLTNGSQTVRQRFQKD